MSLLRKICLPFWTTQHSAALLFELSEMAQKDLSVLPEAQRLQGILACADYTIAKYSIAGTKYLLQKLYGYGGLPRKPLPPIEPGDALALWMHPHTQTLIKLEQEISNHGDGSRLMGDNLPPTSNASSEPSK